MAATARSKREELRSLIEEYAADPDPLNLVEELAALRALLTDYLARPDAEHKEAVGFLEAISRVVKRIEDVRSQDAISRPELARIYQEMWRAVQTECDPETSERIGEAWLRIRL